MPRGLQSDDSKLNSFLGRLVSTNSYFVLDVIEPLWVDVYQAEFDSARESPEDN